MYAASDLYERPQALLVFTVLSAYWVMSLNLQYSGVCLLSPPSELPWITLYWPLQSFLMSASESLPESASVMAPLLSAPTLSAPVVIMVLLPEILYTSVQPAPPSLSMSQNTCSGDPFG